MSRYIKIPWTIFDDHPELLDDRLLAQWVRERLEAARADHLTRRPYLPERLWLSILDRFDHRCAYCGVSGVPLQREHVIPYSKGGATDETNIVPACAPCNQAKFKSTWRVEWPAER